VLYWIKIFESKGEQQHQAFQWQSERYKSIKAISCSADTELSLALDNGKNLTLRKFDFRKAESSPNGRVFYINKTLNKEIILGVLSKFAPKNASVYLLLEEE
jgi:hypothetical protein